MSLKTLEAAILAELKRVARNPNLRQKDIMEWQTGRDLKPQEGETLYYLPELGVSVAVKLPAKKRKPKEMA